MNVAINERSLTLTGWVLEQIPQNLHTKIVQNTGVATAEELCRNFSDFSGAIVLSHAVYFF